MSMILFYDLRLGVIPCGDHRIYVLLKYACEDVGAAVPRWSVVALGAFEHVAQRAFALAGDCELDHLKSAVSLHMRAEDMLRMWRDACRMPSEMADAVVDLWIGDDDRAPVPRSAATQALDVLRDVGYARFARKLKAGKASLRLCRDIRALVALYGADGPLCASRLPGDAVWFRMAQLARTHVRPGPHELPVPVCCYVLSGQTLVLRFGQDPFVQVHRSVAIRDFVTGPAYGLEMEQGVPARGLVAKFVRSWPVRRHCPTPLW